MSTDVQPLIMGITPDDDGVYRFSSADKKAIMDLDPVAKEIILKWHHTKPGSMNLACIAFFRGWDLYVTPLCHRESGVFTEAESRFLDNMAIAYELVKEIFQPPDVALH